MRLLHRVIRDATDPSVVLRRVTEQALHVVAAADGAAVELLEHDTLTYVCTAGALGHALGLKLRTEGTMSGLAIDLAATLCCDDAETDDRVDREACRSVGARSLVCVPLRHPHDAQALGVLKVTSAQPAAFTADDVTTLARLAGFVAVAISAAADTARVAAEVETFNSLPSSTFVANVLDPAIVASADARRRVERVLDEGTLDVVCQPLVNLEDGTLVGAEALARFPQVDETGPLPPDRWFADAHAAGLGVRLELVAVRKAVHLLDHLPPDAYLTINVGPDVIAAPELAQILAGADPTRVVLELTEHFPVEDYERLRGALCEIRRRGTRLAIDDTGAGFASLAHILKLSPDIIKLDRDLARGIDDDPIRRSLAAALVAFAHRIGAQVVAEGLETEAELSTVRELGIALGQGYLLGRPGPPAALMASV
ncbi:MAG TPA: EAL domain-containing protein [Baekduia sp.]|uniref:sensor domain-containing phosphodiesterase n=1 Tax=Baekduia sp. TaxID=2600305 RepID=UPI002D77934C|nr:EAL domain-containing protein [Baekduia sp.]HET6507816.1 EAL domain-containing protein [Baekduia sp.]